MSASQPPFQADYGMRYGMGRSAPVIEPPSAPLLNRYFGDGGSVACLSSAQENDVGVIMVTPGVPEMDA